MRRHTLLAAFAWCWYTAIATPYPVGPSISLDEMFGQADLVCKAEVVSTKPVEDAWFEKVHSFQPVETRLKVIALYKGRPKAREIAFRHYAEDNQGGGFNYMPQYYKFEVGRTYVVFAAKADEEGLYRQLWKQHKLQHDQGVVLAASKEPHEGEAIKEVIWRELSGLLKSEKKEDVFYGLTHLDEMSGGSYYMLYEFDREEVLDAVRRLITHREPEVARLAITVLGSHNPYLSYDYGPGWLATIGGGEILGHGQWDLTKEYLGGKLYWKQLAAVVDSDAPAQTRALAVRALGRAQEPAIVPSVKKWIADKDPAVRWAAILLIADYSDEIDPAILKKLAAEPEPLVKQGVAQAIGFGQFKQHADVLGKLLADPDTRVRRDAALSLLSLPPQTSRPILEANLEHADYRSLFVNALAAADPTPYLPQLIDIVKNKREPENWWGGRIPWGVSWDLLFRHAKSRSIDKLKSGEVDKVLDALEYPAQADPKGPTYYSSSEPRDLYALYLQRGLTERAKKFRSTCVKNITYDIDYYFKQVDERPETYRRE
jgi:HEAT repeat protein